MRRKKKQKKLKLFKKLQMKRIPNCNPFMKEIRDIDIR